MSVKRLLPVVFTLFRFMEQFRGDGRRDSADGLPSTFVDEVEVAACRVQVRVAQEAGNVDALLRALVVHADAVEESRQYVEYVTTNRQRMKYAEFRAAGLCTSTGVVEAGCKTAIGTRCRRAGMHWTVAGADAIIALRCCKLSGRFEDFWERRAERRAAA